MRRAAHLNEMNEGSYVTPNKQLEPTARRSLHHGRALRAGRGSTPGR